MCTTHCVVIKSNQDQNFLLRLQLYKIIRNGRSQIYIQCHTHKSTSIDKLSSSIDLVLHGSKWTNQHRNGEYRKSRYQKEPHKFDCQVETMLYESHNSWIQNAIYIQLFPVYTRFLCSTYTVCAQTIVCVRYSGSEQ